MIARLSRIALVALALAVAWARRHGDRDRAGHGRIVAGRPFTMTYDERAVGMYYTAAGTRAPPSTARSARCSR